MPHQPAPARNLPRAGPQGPLAKTAYARLDYQLTVMCSFGVADC
jgi:hypothetical protein